MRRTSRKEAARAASVLIGLALLGSVAGCKPEAEDDEPTKPKPIAFTGKTDPRAVGTWKAADGSSVMALSPDGKLALSSSSPGRPGPPTKLDGQWRVDGERLLLKYTNTDRSEQTVGYTMRLAKDAMTLSTKIPKRDTLYKRR